MLKLTRRPGEQIYMFPDDISEDMTVGELFGGTQIVIEVLSMKGNQVKIGIEAPKGLSIVRDDVNE